MRHSVHLFVSVVLALWAAAPALAAPQTLEGKIASMEPRTARLTLLARGQTGAVRLDLMDFVAAHGDSALDGLDVGLAVVAEAEPPQDGSGAWKLLGIRKADDSEEVRVQSDLFDTAAPLQALTDAPANDSPGRKGSLDWTPTDPAASDPA